MLLKTIRVKRGNKPVVMLEKLQKSEVGNVHIDNRPNKRANVRGQSLGNKMQMLQEASYSQLTAQNRKALVQQARNYPAIKINEEK